MKIHELISFNREVLRRIQHVGISPDDYKYTDLYGSTGSGSLTERK
ncbi:MAG: hypothetical protein LBU98_00205 [Alistipes sp.]|jgi:hypothetical protein|nr:hypothetical protein [Alistipes sp.]